MSKYLVKLKPLGPFFFGQENKYRKKRGSGETEADYFQSSSCFPQQTALLGMLRYFILQKNGQIPIIDKDLASTLIGRRGFGIENSKSDFGLIKKLSAVFIIDENHTVFFQNPKDLILRNNEAQYLKRTDAPFIANAGTNHQPIYFNNYVEKDGLNAFLMNSEQNLLPIHDENSETGVFIRQEKIGIKKSKGGKTEDEAFFKQIVYSLNDKYSFGFVAEIDDNELDGYSSLITLGTEKSPFQISFTLFDGEITERINLQKRNSPKIVLLSDAFISDFKKTAFLFSISDTKPFRFLITEVKEGSGYYSSNPLEKKEGSMRRSIKYNLIERGSVFFFTDEEQMNSFADKLKSESNFYQIGYNYFKTI